MGVIKKIGWFPLLIPFLFSCAQSAPYETKVRSTLISTGANQVSVSVSVEGPDGNALTGALVQIKDSSNCVNNLGFNSESYVYKGNAAILPDGVFRISITSILMSSVYSRDILHTPIVEKPQIIEFRDVSGSSVLSGGTMHNNEVIQISWNSMANDIQYIVSCRTPTSVCYTLTTNTSTMQIPANTFTPGRNFYLEIKAQRILGDPMFQKADYCSVANSGVTNVNFTVQ